MKKPLRVVLSILASTLFFAETPTRAADHSDGVKTALDLAADITDLFAFTSPKNPEKVVLVMNVNGFAGPRSSFSDAVDYKIRIRAIPDAKTLVPNSDAAAEQSIVCSFSGGGLFDAKQRATCALTLRGGKQSISFDTRSSTFKAGGSAEKDGTRIFAGVRSDTWFADTDKIGAFDKGKRVDRPNASNHLLQGKNVLSIVVELDKSKLGGSLVGVTAQTVRRSGL